MRRADRLFRIVQYLRGRQLTTAQQLAAWCQVNIRTIYRDIADLAASGTPIEGEAGVGYRLRGGLELPPLHFERDEIEALALGARMVAAWSGAQLGASAEAALAKITSAMPADRRAWLDMSRAFVPQFHIPEQLGERFEKLRGAISERHYADFVYAADDGGATRLLEHHVRPLSLYFWGDQWTLAAWCDTLDAFSCFLLDRILRLHILPEQYADESGKRLADFTRSPLWRELAP